MANVRLANASQQAAMDSVVDLIDAGAGPGTISIYTASQPANANTAVSGQTLLGTLTFADPAFGATTTSGVATAGTITGDNSADATGTAAWARIADSNGATIFDCDVGEAADSATITLDSKSIVSGGTIDITAFTMTHPDGT